MSGSGLEILSDVWEWSGGLPRCPGMVERPCQMSRSGRETLPDVREALSDVRVLGKPSRMSGSGQETLSDVREWSGALSRRP